MATKNPTWGEERIANELLLKIGIQISSRTVRRYMPKTPRNPADPNQRWMTFIRNHAKAIIASDFFVVVTATFQLVYVLVIMEVETRRILYFNVTDTRLRIGRYSSFGNALPAVKDTDSSFMTVTA